MKFQFSEEPNTAVITTRAILDKQKDILVVFHDEDDGMWEFLDGEDIDEKDARIVSISEIYEIDHTIGLLHDLPLGWIAYRESRDKEWTKEIADSNY